MTNAQNRHRNVAIAIGVLAIALRFIDINQPFVDGWSWRQADVAAIARNYYQNGFHFAWPQIDWAGNEPGYVGTEFPILPFAAAHAYRIFGVHEWIGRSESLLFFAVSLPFFFLIARRIFGERAALYALTFYAFAPLGIMASRAFIPDMPSLSLGLIGLYFFLRWIDNQTSSALLAASFAIAFALLIKLTTALIGAPLFFLACQKFRWNLFRQPSLWIFAAIALLPSAIWYWHAHMIAERFYPYHFFGAGGFRIMNAAWYWKIAGQIATTTLTSILCSLAILGLFTTRSTTAAGAFRWWLAAMMVFTFVAGWGNRHQWYQLPFVPIAAAFAGASCAWLETNLRARRSKVFVVGIAIVFVGFALVLARVFYRASAADLRDLGLELKRTTPSGSLIVAANYGDPAVFYYAERKGWHFLETDGIYNGHPSGDADAIADLEQLRRHGATHLTFYSGTFWWLDYYKEFAHHLDQTATLMEATPQFRIYKLN